MLSIPAGAGKAIEEVWSYITYPARAITSWLCRPRQAQIVPRPAHPGQHQGTAAASIPRKPSSKAKRATTQARTTKRPAKGLIRSDPAATAPAKNPALASLAAADDSQGSQSSPASNQAFVSFGMVRDEQGAALAVQHAPASTTRGRMPGVSSPKHAGASDLGQARRKHGTVGADQGVHAADNAADDPLAAGLPPEEKLQQTIVTSAHGASHKVGSSGRNTDVRSTADAATPPASPHAVHHSRASDAGQLSTALPGRALEATPTGPTATPVILNPSGSAAGVVASQAPSYLGSLEGQQPGSHSDRGQLASAAALSASDGIPTQHPVRAPKSQLPASDAPCSSRAAASAGSMPDAEEIQDPAAQSASHLPPRPPSRSEALSMSAPPGKTGLLSQQTDLPRQTFRNGSHDHNKSIGSHQAGKRQSNRTQPKHLAHAVRPDGSVPSAMPRKIVELITELPVTAGCGGVDLLEDDEEQHLCISCLEQLRQVIFIPCGHVLHCRHAAPWAWCCTTDIL